MELIPEIASGKLSLWAKFSSAAHIVLFVMLGILIYWYTLPYPFVFDSRFYLLDNPLITESGSFVRLLDISNFARAYPELNVHRDVVVTFILRPFANFTFHMNYLLNGFNPGGYRVVNISIHIANSILWYLLLKKILFYRDGHGSEQMWFVPFFSALLFLVHPINTESVTYIIQRYTSLGAFFYLLTMLLFLKSLLSSITWQQWVLCAGSVFSLVIGMLSQEGLITAPFVLVLMGTVLLQMPLRTVCARASVHFFCLPIIPTVVYLITAAQSEKINRIIDGYPPYEYAITQTRVILTYLRMLIAPYGQNIDPTYPLYRSIAEPEVVISIAVLFLFLIAGVVLLYRKQRSSYTDLLGFCIFFSFFAICVSSSIFPLPDLMAEHRSYLFSLPVITGLVCLVESIRTQLSSKWRIAVITFLGILVVLYATLTVSRNHLYATQSSMWEDAVSKSPDKWRPHYNAGNAYVDEHEYGKALYYYQRAIQINPYKIQSYSNLGSTYMLLSNYHAAIETYRNGLAVSGDNPILLINLGIAYRQAGQLQDAIEVTESSINSNPDVFAAYKLLAELYAATGDNGKSMSYIRKARALNGQDSELNLLEDKIRK